jgi:hypothetical protein
MELTIEPELYSPSIDNIGNYIDKIPSIKHGIRCPCGSRKDKIYNTHTIFSAHIKTKTHQLWLEQLNLNKANFYVENENLKNTIQQQKIIIAKLDKEIQNNKMIIDYLAQQLHNMNNNNNVTDLLTFD